MKRILYITSRFPALSETFIAREMDFLSRRRYGILVLALKGSRADAGALRPGSVVVEPSVVSPFALIAGLAWAGTTVPKAALSVIREALSAPASLPARIRLLAIAVLTICYARRLHGRKIDHIRANFLHSEALSALWLSHLLGIGYSLNVHNAVVLFPMALVRKAVCGARFCTAISNLAFNFVSGLRGGTDGVHLIRNGIDLTEFAGPGQKAAPIRHTVLAIGRLIKTKSFDTLIEAASLLHSTPMDVRIRIVGEGPERARLTELIQKRRLHHRVELVGALDVDGVKNELSKASMLVVPSLAEGIPTVIIEAMAMGVPVIATAVGGIPELVDDRTTGLLIRPEDPEDLAGSMMSLLCHPGIGVAMAQEARKRIEAEYDAKGTAARLDALVREACGAGRLEGTVSSDSEHRPSPGGIDVSIIIPCRNEYHHIDGCLRSVLAFHHSRIAFEVIVVDGMSEDGTREKLRSWQARDARISMYDNLQRTTPAALNIGITHAAGERILRLDAHSEYPPEYLEECVAASRASGADNVGGHVVTLSRSTSVGGKIVQALTTHLFGVGDAGFRLEPSDGPADTVPYGCFRRDIFDHIGKFDERLLRNQDYEFNRRILAAGGRVWKSKKVRLTYYNQGSVRGLLKQAYTTSLWNPWMWFVAPYTFAYRHLIPAAFVGALILGVAAGFLASWWPLAALLSMYALPACVSSLQQALRYGLALSWALPFFFFCYHVAYGMGILWGTMRLLLGNTPVQRIKEPWPGAGRYRAWPFRDVHCAVHAAENVHDR